MVYNLISSKAIISRIYRDYKPTIPGWEGDAIEWIGDAMEGIGQSAGLIKKSTGNEGCVDALTIENYRAKLPCDLVNLQAVEYNGRKLPFGSDLTGYGLPTSTRSTNIYTTNGNTVITDLSEGLSESTGRVIDNAIGPEEVVSDYYLINPNYIITSFETGHIKLHYEAYPIDDEGFPMIPNHRYHKEAAEWLVVRNLIRRGYTNPVIDFDKAHNFWCEYKRLAQNRAAFPSIDQVDRFKNMWVRLVPNVVLPSDFFAGGETSESIKYV